MTNQIAILGLGSIGLRHARNFISLGATVVGFDPNPDNQKLLQQIGGAVSHDRSSALSGAVAAVIASPNACHLDDLHACIEHGVHVLVEKPLGHDFPQASMLLELANEKNITVCAALNLRHHPGVVALRNALHNNASGRILSAQIVFSDFLPNWRPRQDYRLGYTASPETGGIIFDRIHELDLANFLLGKGQVVGATAFTSGLLDITSEDSADILLTHESSAASSIHIDYCSRPRRSTCDVTTETGSFHLDIDARTLTKTSIDGSIVQNDHFPGAYDDDYLEEAKAFLDCIQERAQPVCPGDEALSVLEQALCARRMCGLPEASQGQDSSTPSTLEKPRYDRSFALQKRAEKTIPLASQTFSKSAQQFPMNSSPLFVTHGEGARVWDVDGNCYIDMIGGLFPLILGYRDPDVDQAIRNQLDKGISFSLSTELEAKLAEYLVELVPSAQKVRFGKNGTDATSAAVRLARAHTKRERIAVCGYHGWQDWYIGTTTRFKGIPETVRDLTHVFKYNDLASLDVLLNDHRGEFAAVVMEPMNVAYPDPGFLEGVRELTKKHGTLLVFDEVITGFRFDLGGAQSAFGVTPDLTAFGKALGNGMPISAIVGNETVMAEMEEIFFSGTYGGEALSLAAAIAVIDKMRSTNAIDVIKARGELLAADVERLIESHNLSDVLGISGWPSCKFIIFKDHPAARKEVVRTIFQREMIRNGVLIINAHALSYAHDDACLDHVRTAYAKTFEVMAKEVAQGDVENRMSIPAIEPVFKVR